jgi:hypothetical protein
MPGIRPNLERERRGDELGLKRKPRRKVRPRVLEVPGDELHELEAARHVQLWLFNPPDDEIPF